MNKKLDNYLEDLCLDKYLEIFYEIQDNIIQLDLIKNDIKEYSKKIKEIDGTKVTKGLVFSSNGSIEADPNLNRHLINFFVISKIILDKYLKIFNYLSKILCNNGMQTSIKFDKFILDIDGNNYDDLNKELLVLLKNNLINLILIREIRNSLKIKGYIGYDFRQIENEYKIFITHTIKFNKDNKLFDLLNTGTDRDNSIIEINDINLFIKENINFIKEIWNILSKKIQSESNI